MDRYIKNNLLMILYNVKFIEYKQIYSNKNIILSYK